MKVIKAQALFSRAEIRGRSKQIKEKVREEIGKLGNNKTWQLKGKIEQAEGKARQHIGKAVRRARMRL